MGKNPFKPEIKINFKQIILIILILGTIACIPFVISYIQNPDKRSIGEIVETTIASFKISTVTEADTPFTLTIPIITQEIDITILKKNPQLITYSGLGFVAFAVLIGITLMRSLAKK